MNKLKRFVSTTVVYFTGNVLSKLIVFFLMPLYTSKIIPEQYGAYDLVLAFINLMAPIVFLQIWDGMFRISFDYKDDAGKYKIINNALVICGIGMMAYTIIFLLFYMIFKMEYSVYIFTYGLVFSLHYLFGYICRVFLANQLYVVSGLFNTTITAVLNIVLIAKFNWDVKSLYLAPVIGMIVQMLIIGYRFKIFKHFNLKDIQYNDSHTMIKFSIPLCLSSISFWLLSGFTRLLITSILGTAENGLFAIANRFSTMVVLIITIFQYSWNELAYLASNDDNRVKTYNLCIDLLLKFVTLGSAGLCILIKLAFPYLIHEQYAGAINIIPATIIGSMMNAMAGFIATLFMTEKKTHQVMISTIIASVINIVFGFIFTTFFGLHGATLALATAFTFLMAIRLIQAKKNFKIEFDLKQTILILIMLILSVCEYYLINNVVIDVCTIITLAGVFLISIRKYITIILSKFK